MNKDVAKHVQNGIQALTTAMICYPDAEDQENIRAALDRLFIVRAKHQSKRKKK